MIILKPIKSHLKEESYTRGNFISRLVSYISYEVATVYDPLIIKSANMSSYNVINLLYNYSRH